jgi:putative aldouronate transport system substrate-binding protein
MSERLPGASPEPGSATSRIPGNNSNVRVTVFSSGNPTVKPKDQNKYWQELEKRLGVTWDCTIIPGSSYPEKLAVLTASGDMGDLVLVNLASTPEQNKFIQQGAYTDLTSYLSGDALKEFPNLATFSPQIWKNSMIQGKIYGVPRPRFLTNTGQLWRQDWATKFNDPGPKTLDDYYSMLENFTNKDPDGDGQKNTWALGDSGIAGTGSFSSLSAHTHIMGMFKVPYPWKVNSDGTLTYFIETPEYKDYLTFVTKIWSAGLYYPDTLTQTSDQNRNNFVGGKYGGIIDTVTGIPNATGRRAVAKTINPNADVVMLIPGSADGSQGLHYGGPGYYAMAMIPSKAGKDPERVKELLRILDYFAGPFGSEENIFTIYGIEGVDFTMQANGTPALTDLGKNEIGDLNYIMQPTPWIFYPAYPDQGPLVQNTIKTLLSNAYFDPTITAYSATWVSKQSELITVINDGVNAIVTGRQPISALDKIISDWKSRGGDTAAKEFATALKG